MSRKDKQSTNSAAYLVIGVLAGIIIGFGTTLLVQNYKTKNVHPFSIHPQTTSASEAEVKNDKMTKLQKTKITTKNEYANENYSNDTLDSFNKSKEYDDSLYVLTTTSPDGIQREELLGIKKIKVVDNSSNIKDTSEVDIAISELTGVKTYSGAIKEYIIEFWQNPLNYRGYKLAKDKIIIYGLHPDNNYSLSYNNGTLTLHSPTSNFILKESSEFIPLTTKK